MDLKRQYVFLSNLHKLESIDTLVLSSNKKSSLRTGKGDLMRRFFIAYSRVESHALPSIQSVKQS